MIHHLVMIRSNWNLQSKFLYSCSSSSYWIRCYISTLYSIPGVYMVILFAECKYLILATSSPNLVMFTLSTHSLSKFDQHKQFSLPTQRFCFEYVFQQNLKLYVFNIWLAKFIMPDCKVSWMQCISHASYKLKKNLKVYIEYWGRNISEFFQMLLLSDWILAARLVNV